MTSERCVFHALTRHNADVWIRKERGVAAVGRTGGPKATTSLWTMPKAGEAQAGRAVAIAVNLHD